MHRSIPVWGAAAGILVGAALLIGRLGFASAPGIFGTGRNPTQALLVTADGGADGGGVTWINYYAALTQTAAPGATTLTVDNPTNFPMGTTAMVWQTTGLTNPGLDAGWQAPDGGPLNYDLTSSPVGNYEWVLVASVTGNTLTLTQPLSSSYGYAGGFSQVITVPAYTTVTVNPGGSIVPGQPWDGTKGGVVVFTAQSVVNNGQILADGYGFRGGVLRNEYAGSQIVGIGSTNYYEGCTALLGWVVAGGASAGGAHKGEGIVPGTWINEIADGGPDANYTFTNDAATPADPTYFTYGRGNIANGGGGGDCTTAGGGGGGNGSQGGMGGSSWAGGDGARAVGGMGGSALTYNTTDHLMFGGGGGSGGQNNFVGTGGGNGGGIVFIQAGTISGTGSFTANGTAPPIPPNSTNNPPGGPNLSSLTTNTAGGDGAGGGGAGGVVVLKASSTACGLASANGGVGGSSNGTDGECEQGAGGGAGRLDIQPYIAGDAGACPGFLTPGAPGISAGQTPPSGIATSTPDGGTPANNTVMSSAPGGFDASVCNAAAIAAGGCGGCTQSSDCAGTTTPVCNTTTFTCVQCVVNPDCNSFPSTPYCNDGNNTGNAGPYSCVGCLTTAECQLDGGSNLCQASTNSCVAPGNLGDGGESLPLDGGTDGGGGGGGTGDAGSTGDAGVTPAAPSSNGCSCHVGDSASSSAASAALVAAIAALAALLRVRRPRRRSS